MKETSKGIWRLRVYVGDDPVSRSPAQRQRRFRGTETQARKALVSFQSDVQREPKFDKGQATVGELLDRWLEHIEALGKARPKTLYEYRNKIERNPARPGTREGFERCSVRLRPRSYRRTPPTGSSGRCAQWKERDLFRATGDSTPAPRAARMRIPTTEQLRLSSLLLRSTTLFSAPP
jgi:hypothetical protein